MMINHVTSVQLGHNTINKDEPNKEQRMAKIYKTVHHVMFRIQDIIWKSSWRIWNYNNINENGLFSAHSPRFYYRFISLIFGMQWCEVQWPFLDRLEVFYFLFYISLKWKKNAIKFSQRRKNSHFLECHGSRTK